MSSEIKCPKCSGDMREGELAITIRASSRALSQVTPNPFALPSESSLGTMQELIGEGPFWSENTGKKKGLLIKRDEKQILKISGLRCTKCGFIELYVKELLNIK